MTVAGVLWGIDIGGTKLAVSIATPAGEVLDSARSATDPDAPAADTIDAALDELRGLSNGRPCAGLGVACPGPFDRLERRFLELPNLPAWSGFALGEHLDTRGVGPAVTMNDANAAALAEWRWGAGRGSDAMAFLTMSTGCGGGIVLGGRVHEGPRGFAGEVGRIALADDGPVGFGAAGTAEGFLSGPGLAQMATAEALACRQRGEATDLASDPRPTSERLCALAAAGDAAAVRVLERSAARLGRLCAILANTLELDRIVLGTIAEAHPALFIPRAEQEMRRHTVPAIASSLRIVPGELGERRAALAPIAAALRTQVGFSPPAR